MRVPDLDWPADLFDDVAPGLSPQIWPVPLRAVNADRPFWPAMLQMWTRTQAASGLCRPA
jgi:hypothetical protein